MMIKKKQEITLGVFIPVWNRSDLFKLCFDSLIKQLDGIRATIFIYDNGSDVETVEFIQSIKSDDHLIIKIFLPVNMGIPYVANLFAKSIGEDCDFTGYHSPEYVLIMDADAYFTKPIRHLLELFTQYYSIGLLSGHDSVEHESIFEKHIDIDGKPTLVKEKENERMITMFMRKEEFTLCYPFPHYRYRDVDWELTQWNINSMKKRSRSIYVLCGYVLHLGLYNSTWQGDAALIHHTEEEISEVNKILNRAY